MVATTSSRVIPAARDLGVDQDLRDHADDLAAGRHRGPGQHVHQPDAGPAVDDADARLAAAVPRSAAAAANSGREPIELPANTVTRTRASLSAS